MTAALQMDLLDLLAVLPAEEAEPRPQATPSAPASVRRRSPLATVKAIEAGAAQVPLGERDWRDGGVCQKLVVDDDFWFPEYDRSGRADSTHQEEVREVCGWCPFFQSCASDAYRNPQGVTGYRAGVYCGPNPDVMPKRAFHALYLAAVHGPAK